MAKTIGEFIFDLAKKAGVAEDNEALKAWIQDKDLFNKPFPEALETGIDNQLISIKDATNNHPKIKSKYYSDFADGLDKIITPLLADFDQDAKTEIESETTFKRIPLLFSKIRELENKKHAANPKDKEGVQKQIDDLHKQLADEKTNAANLKKQYDSELSNYKIDYRQDSLLSGYKTIYDDLDPEIRSTTLKTIVNKNLQDNKARFAFDEHGNFVLLKQDGTNYYGDNHQQIEPKGFIEQILSRNKLLKVSDQSGNAGAGVNRNGQQPPQGGNGNNSRNTTLSGLAQQAMKDLDNATAVNVMG